MIENKNESLINYNSGKSSIVLAAVGMPGAGKSVLVNYLQERYHIPKVYMGEVTFDEMRLRELPINEENERFVREDLRKTRGREYYAEQLIPKVRLHRDQFGNIPILVESLYMWEEFKCFENAFPADFMVVAVHARRSVRYHRLATRKVRPLTVEESRSRDFSQIENIAQGGPIAMADIVIVNEGSIEDVHRSIDKMVLQLFPGL